EYQRDSVLPGRTEIRIGRILRLSASGGRRDPPIRRTGICPGILPHQADGVAQPRADEAHSGPGPLAPSMVQGASEISLRSEHGSAAVYTGWGCPNPATSTTSSGHGGRSEP